MSVEERSIEVITCDACGTELTSDYVYVKNAEITNVYNGEVVSTLTLEDKHFCNRACMKEFIEVYV